MRKNKDLKECLATLKAVHSNNDLKPEQKAQIEIARDKIKRLSRKKNPSQADVFACVKEVAQRLLSVILNKD